MTLCSDEGLLQQFICYCRTSALVNGFVHQANNHTRKETKIVSYFWGKGVLSNSKTLINRKVTVSIFEIFISFYTHR